MMRAFAKGCLILAVVASCLSIPLSRSDFLVLLFVAFAASTLILAIILLARRYLWRLRHVPTVLFIVSGFLVLIWGTSEYHRSSDWGAVAALILALMGAFLIVITSLALLVAWLVDSQTAQQHATEANPEPESAESASHTSPAPAGMHPDVAKKRKEKYLREVMSAEEDIGVLQQTHGANHPLTADAMKRLALLHANQHENTCAEATFRDALHAAEQNRNDHPRELVDILRQFASFLENTGRPDEAKPLRKRASEVEMNAFKVPLPIVPDNNQAFDLSTTHVASGPHGAQKQPEPEMPAYNLHAEFIDLMVGAAPKTFWTEVLGGGAAPLLIFIWGMRILANARVAFYGYRGSMIHDPLIVEGPPAILFGWVWILVAAAVHFHYFWPYRNRLVCAYGKAVSIVVALIMLVSSMYLITQL